MKHTNYQRTGDHHVTKHSRDTLKVLGSVGEPINPEAWKWYHEVRGLVCSCFFCVWLSRVWVVSVVLGCAVRPCLCVGVCGGAFCALCVAVSC